MTPLESTFANLKAAKRKAFIPFLSLGDPSLDATRIFLGELAEAGATAIELGFPYSDPIADGAVIQASYTRAMANKNSMADWLQFASGLGNDSKISTVPRLAMLSYSLIHPQGLQNFVNKVKIAGIVGLIVPDLPVDESTHLLQSCKQAGLDLIQLVTPTTPRERAKRILDSSSGFVYCVSVAGITGERRELPQELLGQLDWLRSQTALPLCVGFGISRPDQVEMLRNHCDGVIVGSALVRLCENAGNQPGKQPITEVVKNIGTLARSLVAALNPAG